MSAQLVDESDAYRFLERLRWNGAPPSCPHCDATGRCYFLAPADGRSRPTRTGARSQRRVWKCGACRRQFSVLTGTVLQGTRVGILTWIAVLADMTAAGGANHPAAVADRFGLSPETARHLVDRLRAAGEVEPMRSCVARIAGERAGRAT